MKNIILVSPFFLNKDRFYTLGSVFGENLELIEVLPYEYEPKTFLGDNKYLVFSRRKTKDYFVYSTKNKWLKKSKESKEDLTTGLYIEKRGESWVVMDENSTELITLSEPIEKIYLLCDKKLWLEVEGEQKIRVYDLRSNPAYLEIDCNSQYAKQINGIIVVGNDLEKTDGSSYTSLKIFNSSAELVKEVDLPAQAGVIDKKDTGIIYGYMDRENKHHVVFHDFSSSRDTSLISSTAYPKYTSEYIYYITQKADETLEIPRYDSSREDFQIGSPICIAIYSRDDYRKIDDFILPNAQFRGAGSLKEFGDRWWLTANYLGVASLGIQSVVFWSEEDPSDTVCSLSAGVKESVDILSDYSIEITYEVTGFDSFVGLFSELSKQIEIQLAKCISKFFESIERGIKRLNIIVSIDLSSQKLSVLEVQSIENMLNYISHGYIKSDIKISTYLNC